MFGNKKLEEVTKELTAVKKELSNLKDKTENFDFLNENSLLSLVSFDYDSLITFSGTVTVVTSIKIGEDNVHYYVELYKNDNLVRTFVVHKGGDGGLHSYSANTRRRITYELTCDIAKFMINQLTLCKDRMGYKCEIKLEDRLPYEYASWLGNGDIE